MFYNRTLPSFIIAIDHAHTVVTRFEESMKGLQMPMEAVTNSRVESHVLPQLHIKLRKWGNTPNISQ